ncbi:MAG TPA: glycosyltransferase family 4 protein [Candidatus Saccharimonadales bacterium]|nr:glycosyltransferase family 4 protein [Candidatus Saccharimonadales bacterium]
MISFVWSASHPFRAGAGGSENYTVGHIRELQRRGIPARMITVGFGTNDGREDFPDITFASVATKEELSKLDDTLVFVTYPLDVQTRRPAYAILHCPPLSCGANDPLFDFSGLTGKQLLAPSKFAAKMWRKYMHQPLERMPAVYPFAEPVFSKVERPDRPLGGKPKVLFAGRLKADKGIYTLLAALHVGSLRGMNIEVTATAAAKDTPDGEVIHALLQAHPNVTVVPARRSPADMAALMAEHDIVVMPSSDIYWKEIFGIVSVEAQHAGCRVVASNAGGLPETDCGGLLLVKPDDPLSLANGIARAAYLGPLTVAERMHAATKFTVAASVNKLLSAIDYHDRKQEARQLLYKQGALMREQLDTAFKGIMQLGLRTAAEEKLPYRQTSR